MLSVVFGEGLYSHATFEVAISATCFIVWDTIINIGDEVEYIWGRPSSFAKWTYLFVRHFPYIVQGTILTLVATTYTGVDWTPKQCYIWLVYQVTAMEAITVAVEGVLIMRIYALYNQNKILIAALLFLFVSEVIGMSAVLGVTIPQMSFTPQCIVTSSPPSYIGYWVLSLCFETVLFALTLIKFYGSLTRMLGRRSVLYILVRDGTWAYAVIFVIMLANFLMYHLERNALAGIFYYWEMSVMSFAGSHILLNLRRLAVQVHTSDPSFPPSWTDVDVSAMQFPPQHVPSEYNLTTSEGVLLELQAMSCPSCSEGAKCTHAADT